MRLSGRFRRLRGRRLWRHCQLHGRVHTAGSQLNFSAGSPKLLRLDYSRSMSGETRRRFLQMAGAAAIPEYQIYDSHVHVWEHKREFPFAPAARVPDEDASPEELLRLMAGNGIAKTVIIQVIHYRYDNSYLADVLRRYPGKFVGVCRVDPLNPAAPDHLSRLTKEGFQGVRLSPAGDATGDWIRGPLMPPLWQRCEELGVPMTLLAPITRMEDVGRL